MSAGKEICAVAMTVSVMIYEFVSKLAEKLFYTLKANGMNTLNGPMMILLCLIDIKLEERFISTKHQVQLVNL